MSKENKSKLTESRRSGIPLHALELGQNTSGKSQVQNLGQDGKSDGVGG